MPADQQKELKFGEGSKAGKPLAASKAYPAALSTWSPLRELIFSHEDVFDAFWLDLPLGVHEDFKSGAISLHRDDGSGFSINPFTASEWGCEESGEWFERSGSIFQLFQEPANSALLTFSELAIGGALRLWGRWNSRRADFEPIPPDAWPHRPLDAIRVGNLIIETGFLSLDSGEKIYSIHLEDTSRPARMARLHPVFDDHNPFDDAPSAPLKTGEIERLLLQWMMASPKKRITNADIKKRLRNAGRSTTDFDVFKREARSMLKATHPEIESLYALNDPKKKD